MLAFQLASTSSHTSRRGRAPMFPHGVIIIPYVPKVVRYSVSTLFPYVPLHPEGRRFQQIHRVSTPPLAARRSPTVMLRPRHPPCRCLFTPALRQGVHASTRLPPVASSFAASSIELLPIGHRSAGSLTTNQLHCVQVTFASRRRLCSNVRRKRPRRYVPCPSCMLLCSEERGMM